FAKIVEEGKRFRLILQANHHFLWNGDVSVIRIQDDMNEVSFLLFDFLSDVCAQWKEQLLVAHGHESELAQVNSVDRSAHVSPSEGLRFVLGYFGNFRISPAAFSAELL